MSFIATLISNPKARALSPTNARRAAAAVGGSSIRWLDQDVACEFDLQSNDMRDRMMAALQGAPVDIVIQPAAGRRRQLLIADMDSTMIDQECIDELADEVGLKEQVAGITARSMNGEIAFEPALRERVALLKGLEETIVEHLVNTRLTLAAGGRELVATMNRDGAMTALVSGGFDAFTSRIAARLGFRQHRANRLIVENGRLTGQVAEPILGREAKAVALREICASIGITPAQAIAVGDGANDLDMLAIAGAGVALHAKPAVAAAASIRIDHGDLTALLFMQGYRRDEFAPLD